MSYKLGLLDLTRGLGTTVKNLFNWLDKPLKKTLTKTGGIKAILQKYSNDEDFKRSVMVLKYMKKRICSGYASIDLAKKLEIALGRKKSEESDDIIPILKWNTAESISDPLLYNLASSVRSLFFSSELNGNLSIEENFVDTGDALTLEVIRYKKIKRQLEGLGLITKSNFVALLEQLNRYEFPIGLQLSANQHSINIVKRGNIFTSTDPDGEETNNLEKGLVEFVNLVFEFLEVTEKNYCMMSIVLYLPSEIKKSLSFDLYEYFLPERKRTSLRSVNSRVEDNAVLKELKAFSDLIVIVCANAFDFRRVKSKA